MTWWSLRSAGRLGPLVLAVFASLSLGGVAMGQSCPAVGECVRPHPTPGCEDEECCLSVCATDVVCCTEEWDETCAGIANAICDSICGSEINNSCFELGVTPACDNSICCIAVCDIDPFCCSEVWDQNCVVWASFQFEACALDGPSCGDPDAGDCLEANGSPSCSNGSCCDLVCEVRPECCSTTWDTICVSFAETLCFPRCSIDPLAQDALEDEPCDGPEVNDPCSDDESESLQLGVRTLGRFRSGGDRDGYRVDLAPLDGDGDGLVQVRLTAIAEDASFQVITGDCGSDVRIDLDSTGCVQFEEVLCIPATETLLLVSPIGDPGDDCEDYVYAFTLEAQDFCGPPCENSTPCLSPHAGPGCEDSACCEMVCEADPACCLWVWDSGCAVVAASMCGGPPPANDACGDAILAFDGRTPFRQLLSTVAGPQLDCAKEPSTGDVWFSHRVQCAGDITIRTCGQTDFDTVLEVYRGACKSPTLLDCNDDYELCFLGNSQVTLSGLVCGERLLIRVSGTAGSVGNGNLDIICLGNSCPCSEDLNGDGRVDGADFGLLLLDWGACPTGCLGDLTGDLKVDGADIGLMLLAWGDC